MEALKNLISNPPEDETKRRELCEAARELYMSLETPFDAMHRLFWSCEQLPLLQIGVDLSLFRILSSEPNRHWSLADLATKSKSDPALLHRLVRYLSAFNTLTLNPTDSTYTATPTTTWLATPGGEGGVKHYHTTVSPVARALPEFLAKTGYKDTSDPANCAFQLAWQTDKPAYGGWGPEDKSLIPAFTAFMTAQRATQASWTSTFPMQNLCLSEEDAAHDRVLFVDVGGSAGHQCQSLRASHPDLKGRVVLQDVAGVIARLDTAALAEQGIEAAAHDFFTPQPPSVRGAKAFYLRNVLHDWPSPTCVEILQHLREACAEDSVVLIDEVVVRDEAGGKGWMGAQKDVQMLACTAGRERSLREWEELVQTADLRVREVVGYGGQGDGIVVCVPI